jgi:hypothetical protein
MFDPAAAERPIQGIIAGRMKNTGSGADGPVQQEQEGAYSLNLK